MAEYNQLDLSDGSGYNFNNSSNFENEHINNSRDNNSFYLNDYHSIDEYQEDEQEYLYDDYEDCDLSSDNPWYPHD